VRLRWTRRAEADLDTIWHFIASRDVVRADALDAYIRRRAERLASFPGLGRPIGKGVRDLSLTDIQYVVRHVVTDDEIRIIGVRHTRQQEKP